MTYAGYTCSELLEMAQRDRTVNVPSEVLSALLHHIEDLQVELAEERATIVQIQFNGAYK